MSSHTPFRRLSIPLLLAAVLLPVLAPSARADMPPPDKSFAADWACVTDAAFVEAFERLGAHRAGQGLVPVVVSLDEVLMWSPAGDDTTAGLRWFADVAHGQWGARYLLLGGDHPILPAPYGRTDLGYAVYEYPVDAWYACLGEGWDLDGDGWVAEQGDDQPDLEIHLAVGRLPVDSVAEAEAVVDKTIAFEERRGDAADRRVLNAAGTLDAEFAPGDPGPPLGLYLADDLADVLAAAAPDLPVDCLYQEVDVPLCDMILTPESLVDVLSTAAHDFVGFYCLSNDRVWSCGELRHLTVTDMAPLEDLGEAAFYDVPFMDVARTDGDGLMEELVTMSGGGAVAGRGASGVCYVNPASFLNELFWQEVFADDAVRLGDAHTASVAQLPVHFGEIYYSTVLHTVTTALLGDPALRMHPLEPTGAPVAAVSRVRGLAAAPNPFNPATEISFVLEGPDDARTPVRVEAFDVRGRRVRLLMDAALAPGRHAVTWRGDDREAGGVFFVRVRAGGRDEVIKVARVE